MKHIKILILFISGIFLFTCYAHSQTPAPDWTKDLIIYQINPYAFTSPDGAGDGGGSGNFKSLTEKLNYLKDLGITGIWLAGFSESTTHFHKIPTVYACYRPDKIDPRLGTETDFKEFISEAHNRGIRVFLDVITHGVVKESPLFQEQPEWFDGESWGMVDYDYDNEQFKKWWINLWINYVLEYGVDGYRLDGPNGYESREKTVDVWNEITATCAERGHPIIVFPENTNFHFKQGERYQKLTEHNLANRYFHKPRYKCRAISMHDSGHYKPAGETYYRLKGSRFIFGYVYIFGYDIPLFMSGEEFNADYVPLPNAECDLFGGGGPSTWLYASWIQWEQLSIPAKKEMHDDCRKMIKIRNENSDILHYDRSITNILQVKYTPETLPVPYIRYIPGEKAILIAGNNSDTDVSFCLDIPLNEMKMEGKHNYRIIDLWNDKAVIVSENDLHKFEINVPADYTTGGGVRAFQITGTVLEK